MYEHGVSLEGITRFVHSQYNCVTVNVEIVLLCMYMISLFVEMLLMKKTLQYGRVTVRTKFIHTSEDI